MSIYPMPHPAIRVLILFKYESNPDLFIRWRKNCVNFVWQESLILMGLIDVEALRVGAQIKDKDAGDVSRFLNRILGLSVAKQNCVRNKRGELKDCHLVSCYKLLLTEMVSLFFVSLSCFLMHLLLQILM